MVSESNQSSTIERVVEDKITLKGEIVTFTGPPDSGKSNLVKYLLTLDMYASHLVYDCFFGFDPEKHNVIRPPNKDNKWRRYEHGNPELNRGVDEFVLGPPPSKRPEIFTVDEVGRLLPEGKPEGEAMGELNDFNAHYGIGVWLIGQRHTQMNSDFENKATHHFVMGYSGKNNKRNLKDLHENAVEALDRIKEIDPYGFIYVGPNNTLRAFTSVPEVGEKGMV